MKYFTPELYERLQNLDTSAMDAADAEWDAAEARYQQRLQDLGEAVAPLLNRFAAVLLHDALVLGIGRRGNEFSILLLQDSPPGDLVSLVYVLTGEPFIDQNAVAAPCRSGTMLYEYDEFDVVRESGASEFSHSILFSNGWEIRLRFRDVRVIVGQPVYPMPTVSLSAPSVSASA